MLYSEAVTRKRAFVGAAVLIGLAPAAFAIVMADQPDKPMRSATCHKIDASAVAQLKPVLDRPDEPAGAAFDRAITAIAAARRLCESGDTNAALTLYRRVDNTLTRFQSAAQPPEER